MAGFLVSIEVDPEGISVIEPSNQDMKKDGKSTGLSVENQGDGDFEDSSELPKYMIYMMAGIVVFLILVFIVWYCARKRMMIKVREKIHNLRIQARPENLIKHDIKSNLKKVKFKGDKDNKQEGEPCAICCDEFKVNEMISMTECKHLFHDTCVWQWIETKIKQTIAQQERDAPNGTDLNQLHPSSDCVQCPNCNNNMIKSTDVERKAKQAELYKEANEAQAQYMGISRQEFEEIQNQRDNNRLQAINQIGVADNPPAN